jgi:glutaredoxin
MPLDDLVDTSLPAQVFGRPFDMWTNRATDLFDRLGWRYVFVDLDDPRNLGVSTRLIGETRRYQTPYVFVRGRFVGGFAEIDELERLGQLSADDAKPGRTDVVVVAREQEFVPPGQKP